MEVVMHIQVALGVPKEEEILLELGVRRGSLDLGALLEIVDQNSLETELVH